MSEGLGAILLALSLLFGAPASGAPYENAGVALTAPAERGPYGGSEIWGVYTDLNSTPGWWNADGNLTLEEFNGLLILHEASLSGRAVEVLLAEVVARQLWTGGIGGNPPYCNRVPCVNGAFNYWAAYSESAHRIADVARLDPDWARRYARPNLRARLADAVLMRRAAFLGALALESPPQWREQDNDAPFGWGNDGAWTAHLAAHGIRRGRAPGQIVYWGGGFLVYTPNQAACHRRYLSGEDNCWK